MPYGDSGRRLVYVLLAIIALELIANIAITIAALQ